MGILQARWSRPQLRVGALTLAGLALLGAGCSNKVVTLAQVPSDTTTTTVTAVTTNVRPFVALEVVSQQVAAANPPSAAEIANAPINVLRAKTLSAITARLTALNAASTALGTVSSAHISASALAAERAEIGTAISGLTSLQGQIAPQQSLPTLRTDAKQMINYLNVGTVIVPKVQVLVQADGILRATDSLSPQIAALQAQINGDVAKGKSVGAAQAALAGVSAAEGAAVSVASGLMNSVPAITTPAQITADQASLGTAKTSLTSAQTAMTTVRADLSAVNG